MSKRYRMNIKIRGKEFVANFAIEFIDVPGIGLEAIPDDIKLCNFAGEHLMFLQDSLDEEEDSTLRLKCVVYIMDNLGEIYDG